LRNRKASGFFVVDERRRPAPFRLETPLTPGSMSDTFFDPGSKKVSDMNWGQSPILTPTSSWSRSRSLHEAPGDGARLGSATHPGARNVVVRKIGSRQTQRDGENGL